MTLLISSLSSFHFYVYLIVSCSLHTGIYVSFILCFLGETSTYCATLQSELNLSLLLQLLLILLPDNQRSSTLFRWLYESLLRVLDLAASVILDPTWLATLRRNFHLVKDSLLQRSK